MMLIYQNMAKIIKVRMAMPITIQPLHPKIEYFAPI